MEEKVKIRNFSDLIAWQKAHQLALMIDKVSENFPTREQFGLSNQMRRASVSIGPNIAEGFGRGTAKDKTQFYLVALGSLYELQSQFYIARDLGYIGNDGLIKELSEETGRLISGLIKSTPSR